MKKNVYVELPNSKICTFCGKTGHLNHQCARTEQHVNSNKKVLVRGNNSWYLDSGCSKHMIGDKSKIFSLETHIGETVTFGNNMKGEIIAKGKAGKSSSYAINNVFLVENLKHITIL